MDRVEKTEFFPKIEREIHKLSQELQKSPFNFKSKELEKVLKFAILYNFLADSQTVETLDFWSSKIFEFLGKELKLSETEATDTFIKLIYMTGELNNKFYDDPCFSYYMAKIDLENRKLVPVVRQ